MSSINFSPFISIFENRPAGTCICGSPGSGKTYFLLNVAANALMMEQKLFAIDPKNDLGVLSNVFNDIEYIDINNIKSGALNPFIVLKNIDTNTICSLISIICGDLTDSQIVSITPIINDFIIQNKYRKTPLTFTEVVDYLYANDDFNAQVIGTKLKTHKDSKYGKLLFSDDVDNGLIFNTKSKIISLLGMDLPKANINKLTEEQRFNSGIIYIITNMLKELLSLNKYPTLLIVDEAHIALQNPSFASIIDEFLVLGRSLNVATVLATQNASHFPEGISQLIANKFCFKSSSEEARKFLDLFFNKDYDYMADFNSIISEIGNFEPGECFFIDSKNRSGFFYVTSLFGKEFSSNPLDKQKRLNMEDEIYES